MKTNEPAPGQSPGSASVQLENMKKICSDIASFTVLFSAYKLKAGSL